MLPSSLTPTRRAVSLLRVLARHKTTTGSSTSTTSTATVARLALTHSTYIEGLVPVLRRLLEDPSIHPTIHTIVPGRIAVTRGKAPHFRLRVSAQTEKGHKALARRGQSVQEVFFTGTIDQAALQAALDAATKKELGNQAN